MLAGLVERISKETGLNVRQPASDARSLAVLGTGKLFRDGNFTSIKELMLKRKADRLSEEHDRRHSIDQAA